MLRLTVSTLACLFSTVLACSSSSSTAADPTLGSPADGSGAPSDETASAAACTPPDAPRCGEPVHLADEAAFLAQQKSVGWQLVASSRTGTLYVSPDYVADADLVIDASAIAPPPGCSESAPTGTPSGTLSLRCGRVAFREDAFPRRNGTARVNGVSCAVEREPVRRLWGDLCTKLTIARGTSFRLRNVLLDTHPDLPLPTTEIVAACAAPCASGESRCATTQVCFPLGHDTCAFCEGRTVRECACRAPCNTRADGAACYFDSTPDTPESGVCVAGSCGTTK